jgi:NADPH-dependent glutamate synthase beta subunit-like oxidoreductase/NAD-dependent dihydropyrimidine dehydrogenase PreA subunit
MPQQNDKIISKYQGEKDVNKKYVKLGKKITDVVPHKLFGPTSNDPEYWGLREMLTPDMCDIANKMKLRKFYSFEQLLEMNPDYEAIDLQKILDQMSVIGILEYDYGDLYDHDGPTGNENIRTMPEEEKRKIRRYRVCFFVPGSAELFNSSMDRIEKNPAVTSFFERMTFIPLAGITQMVRPGGDGIGMHVIPVEKAIQAENQSIDVEHISHWLKKYDGHISAGICSCRGSRAMLGDGCTDDVDDWCIQLGDMADYTVETGRAHYITKERALEIIELAEKNGYVHQITNIDGENKIFDICNCNVRICNALRTSMLFNTPYLSKSAYTAKVEKEKCVACGKCVEICPAGAVKLGQKLCKKDGSEVKYEHAPLPDNNIWGEYMWDEDYRDTKKMSNTYDQGSAPCKAACPAHVPIQAYINLAKQGKYRESLAMIKTENPFPSVCGRVCNKRCEDACTRGKIDAPVSIDAIKKFVADLELKDENRYIPEKIVQSTYGKFDEKIAIIGAGPAGLSAAFYLAQMGYKPTVFEKNALPGGMLTYGIPSYKLEKDVIKAEIDVIEKLGAEIKCGVEVGKDVTIEDLKKQGYKAFYIAIGCQGGRRPGVKNDTAEGTDIAVEYLRKSFETKENFTGDVVVVGGGNVSVDCARNAHRLGANSVKMISLEQRDEMPASKEEIRETLEENIEILNGWGPKEVLVDESGKVTGIVFKKCVSVFDENKKFAPKYDENDVLEVKADKIVFAIGQAIEWGDLLKGTKVKFWHGNYPVADKLTYQTDDEDIFVGGDVYTGPKFVIDAIAAGHEAAESLHRHSRPKAHMTIGRDRRNYTPLDKDDLKFPDYDKAGRQEAGMDESVDYKNSFRDAHKTLTEAQVKIETSRCLGCGASYVDPHKCIGCGLCTTKCQFDAIHLLRDTPKCSDMRVAEKKVTGLLSYASKRAVKIILHRCSKEARTLAKKRKAFKQAKKANGEN